MDRRTNKHFGFLDKIEIINESPFMDLGARFYGYFHDNPKLNCGFTFYVVDRTGQKYPSKFVTSIVMEIIDEFHFKTRNSIYRLITSEKQREINIESILNEKESQI